MCIDTSDFCSCYGDHRDLHGLTHSFPTRRSSDLGALSGAAGASLVARAAFATATPTVRPWAEVVRGRAKFADRSEEHTSELQSLMRNSYAALCLNKKTTTVTTTLVNTSLASLIVNVP